MFYIKCGKVYHPWRGLLKNKWIQRKKAISKYAGQVINLVPEPIRRTVNTVTGN